MERVHGKVVGWQWEMVAGRPCWEGKNVCVRVKIFMLFRVEMFYVGGAVKSARNPCLLLLCQNQPCHELLRKGECFLPAMLLERSCHCLGGCHAA